MPGPTDKYFPEKFDNLLKFIQEYDIDEKKNLKKKNNVDERLFEKNEQDRKDLMSSKTKDLIEITKLEIDAQEFTKMGIDDFSS
jgi:hypothetical protein